MTSYVVEGGTPAQDEWGGALMVVGAEKMCRTDEELTIILPDGEQTQVMITFVERSLIQFRGIGRPPASVLE